MGPQRGLLRAGAAPGVRHLGRLEALASAGVLGGAAASLLADLARRELVEGDSLEDIAERLIETGDRTERAAARDLMAVLRRSTVAEKTDPWVEPAPGAVTWPLVEALGADLLARPSLDAGGDSEGPQWEDDLLGDDLLLLDPDTEVPESPIGQAIRSLPDAHRMEAARGLIGQPDFARLALGALSGSDPAAAGACLLLSQQIWPPNAIPGLLAALGRVAASDRSWPVRALAARPRPVRGATTRPLLIALLQDPEPVVAAPRCGASPGARRARPPRGARRLDHPRLAAHA